MATGIVKSFDTIKGYGFIAPHDGKKDIIVYKSAVEAAGLRGLTAGQRISFDIVMERGQPAAVNLRL
jgi:CspA family cold shock protein